MKPIIAITAGDTNGIGYEVIIKSLLWGYMFEIMRPVIYGNAAKFCYGNPSLAPLVYRYKFPSTAIRKERNEVHVRPVAKTNVMLRWAEISIF